MTEDMAKLKCKKRDLVDQIRKLLLEYAETCKALGGEYRQIGNETGAQTESVYANQARRIESNLSRQLLGIDASILAKAVDDDVRETCELYRRAVDNALAMAEVSHESRRHILNQITEHEQAVLNRFRNRSTQ